MRTQSFLTLFVLTLLTLTALGCTRYTCEGVCSQYYGEDGCGRPSVLANGTLSEDAERNCVTDCTEAMYTTSSAADGGQDAQNYHKLEGREDALDFVNCVAEQDYSESAFNATCEDLLYSCSWFRW